MKRRYIVELQQDAAFSNQSFSIKPDQRALSDSPSDIANKNGFKRPDLPSDYKRQRFFSYEVKTTLIESISWQLLYATNLLVAFELITTSKAPPLGITSYSWLPIEGIITVGWLLKSYWNSDSPLFKPTEQTEVSLTQGSQPFAIIAMMHGSAYDQQQSQLSESSGQQAPKANSQPASVFTSPLSYGSGDGYGDPQQHSHTLGLDCFVDPCHGVCKFRSSSENTGPAEGALNSGEILASHTGAIPGQNSCPHNCLCYRCIWNFDPANETSSDPFGIQLQWASDLLFQIHGIDDNPVNTTAPEDTVSCNLTMVNEDGQLQYCEKVYKSVQSLSNHQRKFHTGKKACLAPVVGKDDRLRPCGEVCKNASALSNHKRRAHTGQQTCDVTVIEEDGQQRPCGKVRKNAGALSNHKIRAHTGQQTCDVTVIEEDGQQRPCTTVCKSTIALSSQKVSCNLTMVDEDGQLRYCEKVYKSVQSLSDHQRKVHTGKKNCLAPVVGKDGRLRPCGKVCKNASALSNHKRRTHTGQQTCDVTVVEEDGQQRPCGKVWKNAGALSNHKIRTHTGQQTCDVTVIEEDGQQRPCGTVCKSSRALSSHKRGCHSGQKTCEVIVVGKDDKPQPCGRVCKSVIALSSHKRNAHTGQRICDLTVVGEDGQARPCGTLCKSAQSFSCHKFSHHTGEKICDVTVVDEYGQPRLCGKVYKNACTLSKHKRAHQKRKPVDADLKDGLNPP
ncbi:hypothetical protein [Endozoicomonas sp. 8E]|uniref:hypothetical protein n=1 Tax=Endozoicomonas sp. 8E TaxID=3035692 RepID=UPI00293927D4|nr:hypothetical protein [Endozoicomonas sp. 8E]WOG26979.1 hypothetical protein P6910_20875 [Endozoicomonas sp. 8E]